MHNSLPDYIVLDAFNLWKGAVITQPNKTQLQVVTNVTRLADEEVVVVFIREYVTGEIDGNTTPFPTDHVFVMGYCDSIKVYGNIVCPDDEGDQNHGQMGRKSSSKGVGAELRTYQNNLTNNEVNLIVAAARAWKKDWIKSGGSSSDVTYRQVGAVEVKVDHSTFN